VDFEEFFMLKKERKINKIITKTKKGINSNHSFKIPIIRVFKLAKEIQNKRNYHKKQKRIILRFIAILFPAWGKTLFSYAK